MLDKTTTETIEVPVAIAREVKLFVNLLLKGEIDSLSDLLEKAGLSNKPKLFDEAYKPPNSIRGTAPHLTDGLNDRGGCWGNPSISNHGVDLWQKVITVVEPPSTRLLLHQKCSLLSFDGSKAVIDLSSPPLKCLLKGKIPNIEQAFSSVTGNNVTVEWAIPKNSPPPSTELSSEQWEEDEEGEDQQIPLTPDQEKALSQLKEFTRSPADNFFRVTGYAGTGKSFLITRYIQWLNSQCLSYIAACPTNKAAKNLKSLAKNEGLNLEVKTVAQLLGQQPELDKDTGKELFISQGELDWSEYDVIIIDEFSMLSRDNFQEIVSEVDISSFFSTKVVFVGDRAQLPPVGEKEPIVSTNNLIQKSASLTKVVRYDGELARVAEEVRSNNQYSRIIYPFTTTTDQTILCLPQGEWLAQAIAVFESSEFKQNPDLIRFLAWRNKTVDSLNNFVRSQLWGENAPDYVPGDRLIAKRPLFRPKPGGQGRDKWAILINNSEECQVTEPGELCELVFQGEVYKYWKVEVQPDEGKPQTLSILHSDSKSIHAKQVKSLAQEKQWSDYYDLSRMFDDVTYAYALTTHKAQGSTIDYVFLDVADMRGSSDRQKLLYTALTRASTKVLIQR